MSLNRRKEKVPMYLGLDLSLTGTGIVVLNQDNFVLHAETVKNKVTGMERLLTIRGRVYDILHKFPPKVICVEGYAMGSRSGQAFSIGELGGVIKLLLFEEGYKPYLVPPTRLKKFIVGGGKAEKDMIMMKVFQRWGWEAADNNQSDAYGAAKLAQIIHTQNFEGLLKAQVEVINDILNPPKKKGK